MRKQHQLSYSRSCFAILLGLCLTLPGSITGQGGQRQYAGDYSAIENVITDLYRTVSFDPGGEPDWERLRLLLFTDAVFVMRARMPVAMQKYSTEEFIDLFRRDIETYNMRDTGFNERVAGYSLDSFGRLAHAYVVYEVRLRPEDEQPLQKGVDSLQLVRSEGRWWIASIANDIETPDNMIPERFYENKPGERD